MGLPSNSTTRTLGAVLIVVGLAMVVVGASMTIFKRRGDHFVSPKARAVHATARDLFDRTNGGATFTDFKARVRDADAVQYTDIRGLWLAERLSPEAVQRAL
jgi:hypothetical protein